MRIAKAVSSEQVDATIAAIGEAERRLSGSGTANWKRDVSSWQAVSGPTFLWTCPMRKSGNFEGYVSEAPTFAAHFLMADGKSGQTDHVWMGISTHRGNRTGSDHCGVSLAYGDDWATGRADDRARMKGLGRTDALFDGAFPTARKQHIIDKISSGYGGLEAGWLTTRESGPPEDLQEATRWIQRRESDSLVALARAISGRGGTILHEPRSMILGMASEVAHVCGLP